MTHSASDCVAYLKPETEDATSCLDNPTNSAFLETRNNTKQFALKFSKAPKNWALGFVIGRHGECDILLHGNGISRRHFSIAINRNGNPILWDLSSNGTIVDSFAIGKYVDVRNTSHPIFDGDMIQAGLSRFSVEVPLYTGSEWDAYIGNVLISLPPLEGLIVKPKILCTVQDHGQLSLLKDVISPPSGYRKAVDNRGNFFAIKVKLYKDDDVTRDTGLTHVCEPGWPISLLLTRIQPHIIGSVFDKYLDLKHQPLVTEWPSYGTLAEQTLVSASEMTVILQQVLEAAACIHEHNLVHRDIAPHNIWIMTRSPCSARFQAFTQKQTLRTALPKSVRENLT